MGKSITTEQLDEAYDKYLDANKSAYFSYRQAFDAGARFGESETVKFFADIVTEQIATTAKKVAQQVAINAVINPMPKQWISTNDRLPAEHCEVLTCNADGRMAIAYYVNSVMFNGAYYWYSDNECYDTETIQYWQALPETPIKDCYE